MSLLFHIKSESGRIKSLIEQVDFMYESTDIIDNGRRVRLVAKNGDIFMINLENHVANEIEKYCLTRR